VVRSEGEDRSAAASEVKQTVLAPAAQAELDGAVDWYEARVSGLGLKFMLLVDEALQEIQESPAKFPRWEHDARFRKFVMQRFPYIIFYRDLADRIDVIAIAHGARDPGYWLKRK
jgi:toxin ParE1/3/4